VSDAIDRYLGRLRDQLGRREVDSARLVEEAEEHLREAEAALIEAGWPSDVAAAAAVERFGGPDAVARRLPRVGGPVARQVVVALAPLIAVAMVALGVGGFLSLCLTWLTDGERVGVAEGTLWAEVFAGVVGLGVLETLWRRRADRPPRPSGLPARFVPAAGCVSFGLATAGLVGYGVLLAWWDRSHHMSRPLLTALGCLGAAVFYGVQFAQRRIAGRA
jgi:drug/metabolite transporter (DMT)-like permease